MPDELKPCPFPKCGGEGFAVQDIFDGIESRVVCKKCGRAVIGKHDHDVASAIAAWNALPRAAQWVTYDGRM